MVLANSVEVGLAGFRERAVRLPHGPDVTETPAVRVGVTVYTLVRLEEVDDLLDVVVDLALVGTRDKGGRVVHAGKLYVSFQCTTSSVTGELTSVTQMGFW